MSDKRTPKETHELDQYAMSIFRQYPVGMAVEGVEIWSIRSRNHFNETWYSVYPEWKLKYESEHRHD